jgi:transposase
MPGRKLNIPWHEDAETLRQLYRHEQDAEVKPRIQALWLLRSGHSAHQTADLVGVHYSSLLDWVGWYRAGGIAEVRRHKQGGRLGRVCRLSAAQIAQLQQRAANGQFRTAADAGQWLADTFGVHYQPSGLYRLLHRLGWQSRRTGPQAVTPAVSAQAAQKKGHRAA